MATKMISGRKWAFSGDKANDIIVVYRVTGNSIAAGGEGVELSGVPSVGDAHPNVEHMKVTKVDYAEDSNNSGIVLATVTYELDKGQTDDYECTEWGWSPSTEERELMTIATQTATNPHGKPVGPTENNKTITNSAGDPFDSVPKFSVFAPVFKKTMKFAERQADALTYNCKINAAQVSIGGYNLPAHTLLCSVSESRIFGEGNGMNYQYTIELRYRSQMVKLFGQTEPEEVGWDVAIGDTGMREVDPTDEDENHKQVIRIRDDESRTPCAVTSPALLDGGGHAVSETDTNKEVRNLLFAAYADATFPTWFYEEPPLEEPEDEPTATT